MTRHQRKPEIHSIDDILGRSDPPDRDAEEGVSGEDQRRPGHKPESRRRPGRAVDCVQAAERGVK